MLLLDQQVTGTAQRDISPPLRHRMVLGDTGGRSHHYGEATYPENSNQLKSPKAMYIH